MSAILPVFIARDTPGKFQVQSLTLSADSTLIATTAALSANQYRWSSSYIEATCTGAARALTLPATNSTVKGSFLHLRVYGSYAVTVKSGSTVLAVVQPGQCVTIRWASSGLPSCTAPYGYGMQSLFPSGTAALPSIASVDFTTTGLWWSSASEVGLALNGADSMRISAPVSTYQTGRDLVVEQKVGEGRLRLLASSASTTNASGSPVSLKPGAKNGTGQTGAVQIEATADGAGVPFVQNVAVAALTDGNTTLTTAESRCGIMECTPTANPRTKTTLTASQLVASFPGVEVGSYIEFTVINKAGATNAVALSAGANVTLVGSGSVGAATSARFAWRFTNVTASSEAVTLYRLT